MSYSLQDLFADVRDWLKYAEAKNAAMVAFSGAFGGVIVASAGTIPEWASLYVWCAGIGSALSAVLALFSFSAVLNADLVRRWTTLPKGQGSAIYFASIDTMTLTEFQGAATKLFEINSPTAVDLELMSQIHIVSRLASRKLRLFNVALWCGICAVCTPLGLVALFFVKKNGDA